MAATVAAGTAAGVLAAAPLPPEGEFRSGAVL